MLCQFGCELLQQRSALVVARKQKRQWVARGAKVREKGGTSVRKKGKKGEKGGGKRGRRKREEEDVFFICVGTAELFCAVLGRGFGSACGIHDVCGVEGSE